MCAYYLAIGGHCIIDDRVASREIQFLYPCAGFHSWLSYTTCPYFFVTYHSLSADVPLVSVRLLPVSITTRDAAAVDDDVWMTMMMPRVFAAGLDGW